ncbi:hypothetical protein GCM10011581_46000 [Saccharopolyspora subtropica]|uniref:Uncharacterized protein n=1 Tax=Saccharopolyspora thermophila TaxID=89367 RepID=A0A917K7C8_9PSEU|nr:hypothetical protein [Saccharopolyspora subtropica]GGJ03741.1 hypothetical protein GCM10011581_46000 [Saccharopolyspora subtropica]
MYYSQEHLMLSARRWWCEPGEPIVWAFPDPYHTPLFEVRGLTEHGKKRRNILTRAAFQAGALPIRINAWLFDSAEQADQRSRPTAVVSARQVDSLAVRMTATSGEAVPGELPGILVATPARLALLELAKLPEQPRDAVDKVLDKVDAFVKGNPVGRLLEDFTATMGSVDNFKGRIIPKEGVPEVVERACVRTDQISGYEVVRREFRWLGYDRDNRDGQYLRITFTDGSRLDLHIPSGAEPDLVLGLVRGNGGGSW